MLAAHEGHAGEAVALGLRFLGADSGPPAPIAISTALQGLAALGRTGDVRAIALELALERGI